MSPTSTKNFKNQKLQEGRGGRVSKREPLPLGVNPRRLPKHGGRGSAAPLPNQCPQGNKLRGCSAPCSGARVQASPRQEGCWGDPKFPSMLHQPVRAALGGTTS